jgi:hypothetical protein
MVCIALLSLDSMVTVQILHLKFLVLQVAAILQEM